MRFCANPTIPTSDALAHFCAERVDVAVRCRRSPIKGLANRARRRFAECAVAPMWNPPDCSPAKKKTGAAQATPAASATLEQPSSGRAILSCHSFTVPETSKPYFLPASPMGLSRRAMISGRALALDRFLPVSHSPWA